MVTWRSCALPTGSRSSFCRLARQRRRRSRGRRCPARGRGERWTFCDAAATCSGGSMSARAKFDSAVDDGDAIRPDFIPANRYIGPDIARLEKERLWPRIWHMVCREEEVAQVGDFVTYEIYDESIVVIRSSATEVKAFYNVCQHRGRRIIEQPKGQQRGFFCRFHGWKYHLDGSIAHVHRKGERDNCPGF